jgi:glutamyl-tRNA synthetase
MAREASSVPRGRYAPSPTGEIHLGNASTALLAWLSIRAQRGRFVLRMEDLDRGRARPELAQRILDDLTWLGLDWDEGPDRGGAHAPYDQGSRGARYKAAFDRLVEARRVYPCFCSRKDVAAAASAPHGAGDEPIYRGTCRAIDPAEVLRRIERGQRHAFRFRAEQEDVAGFDDLVRGPSGAGRALDDFVVYRSDGVPAYQLAVVVDDADMLITEVVRGGDLLDSTQRQLALFRQLGLVPPSFAHVPLLLGPDGVRLSKRHRGITLRELRDDGFTPERVVGRLAHVLGLRSTFQSVTAGELVAGFEIERLRSQANEIVVDLASWR